MGSISKEMAMSLAAREVMVLVNKDDCISQSNSKNTEGIDGAIHAYHGKTRFSMIRSCYGRSHSRTRTL